VGAADQIVDAVDDRLADADRIARQVLVEIRRQLLDELLLGFAVGQVS
jgi:hypothetical protein